MTEAWQQQLALLPDYLGQHLLLTITALGLGIGLSLPLAVMITRVRVLQGPVLMAASIVQTIPALALLALMVPLLRRIGFLPAVIALTLYSMLPVIRNTVTGIQEVDPSLVEAGRGLGMTDGQLLRRVQLPLALPVIIAGIRTATVWVVGMATLSTPVGATSLGNYIFSGLQTQNYTAVLVGCLAAAGLALLLDGLIRLLEVGATRRSRPLLATAGLGLFAVGVLGLAPVLLGALGGPAARPVVIGAKTFTEQYVLAQLLENRLAAAGYVTRVRAGLGSTIAFDALRNGELDLYVDYTGTIWANYMQRTDNPGRDAILAGVREWLQREHGIDLVASLGFENTYALAMTAARANELSIRSIADLTVQATGLRIAGDYEFFARPEWAALEDLYGLDFASRVSMDSTLMYPAVVAGEVDVISAYSTDGRIAAFDLAVLSDPRGALPPYDAVLLLAPGAGTRWPQLAGQLATLDRAISPQAMRNANRAVDIDGQSVQAAAGQLAQALNSP
jgi:osmoprotectant transport system permease protein